MDPSKCKSKCQLSLSNVGRTVLGPVPVQPAAAASGVAAGGGRVEAAGGLHHHEALL